MCRPHERACSSVLPPTNSAPTTRHAAVPPLQIPTPVHPEACGAPRAAGAPPEHRLRATSRRLPPSAMRLGCIYARCEGCWKWEAREVVGPVEQGPAGRKLFIVDGRRRLSPRAPSLGAGHVYSLPSSIATNPISRPSLRRGPVQAPNVVIPHGLGRVQAQNLDANQRAASSNRSVRCSSSSSPRPCVRAVVCCS